MFSSVAVAQINVTVGDIAGNVARIRSARTEAAKQGAALVVFPELAVCGYPPEDLVLNPAFRHGCMEAVRALAAEKGPAMIVGSVWEGEGKVYNAALLLSGGEIAHVQPKRRLPNEGVFDEKRVFDAGGDSRVMHVNGTALGVLVCEDIWHAAPAEELKAAGAEAIIVINASPFEHGKLAQRCAVVGDAARGLKVPMLYVNMVGGQDDIVFDGGSFAVDAKGALMWQAAQFEEAVGLVNKTVARTPADESEVWRALCLGLHDYVRKNHFPGVLLGLSGGVDSALVAALAVDALGKEAVLGVLLPSAITSRESVEDAEALAKNLGIRTVNVPIAESREAVHGALQQIVSDKERNSLAVDGNIQARLRGLLLMALSNATGRMLLGTSNKSEVAVGYTTLYGDSCGGYAPIKDVYKTDVYALAKWRNAQGAAIPARSISKAPTAELAPGQKDQDQLPPYDVLDAVLERMIEQVQSVEDIAAAGFERTMVAKVMGMVRGAEYKRRQMPPGAKVSPMLFGRDWRYPLTNRFKL